MVHNSNNKGILDWEKLSAFQRDKLPEEIEVDMKAMNKAFKMKGLAVKMAQALNDEELDYAAKNGLSVLQFRLRTLMDRMLSDILWEEKASQELKGKYMRISGLGFQERMIRYPEIAEEVLLEWALLLGLEEYLVAISPPYLSTNDDLTVYERFMALLTVIV